MRSLAILILALTTSQVLAHQAIEEQRTGRCYVSEKNIKIKDGKIYLKEGDNLRRLHCLYTDKHGLYIRKAKLMSKGTMPVSHSIHYPTYTYSSYHRPRRH